MQNRRYRGGDFATTNREYGGFLSRQLIGLGISCAELLKSNEQPDQAACDDGAKRLALGFSWSQSDLEHVGFRKSWHWRHEGCAADRCGPVQPNGANGEEIGPVERRRSTTDNTQSSAVVVAVQSTTACDFHSQNVLGFELQQKTRSFFSQFFGIERLLFRLTFDLYFANEE